MKDSIMTSSQLRAALKAINHPHYSHSSSRVMGIIGIYHQDPTKPGILGRHCVANIPQDFSFLLEMGGKGYNYNPEFGLVTSH
jgi:hypothetical protein